MKTESSIERVRRKSFSALLTITILGGMIFTPLPAPALAHIAPDPISPPDGTVTDHINYPPLGIPEVSWASVEGATMYRVQFSSDIAFADSNIKVNITTPQTSYTPVTAAPFNDGAWYWRVRVESPSPAGNYSNPVMFIKQWSNDQTAPQLIAPGDGTELDFYEGGIFSWQPVMGAASYRFQIATSPGGFGTPAYNVTTLANAHQPSTKLSNGTYYWRVIPIDSGNREGTPSQVNAFTLRYGTLAFGEVPELLEPANYSTPVFTPSFRWSAVRGAEKYILEYTSAPNCDFSAGSKTEETRNTTFTPVAAFANDIEYCWHVRARSGNSVGDWSETWHFTKQWYIQPRLLTPIENYKYGLYPLYSWTPVPGASHYRIEIDGDPDFINPVIDDVTSNPFYTPRRYTGTPSTPYYWRVTPRDSNNNWGKPSDVSSFTSYYTSTAPILIYPYYYYYPNDHGFYGDNSYVDRAVAMPVFLWHRSYIPFPYGGTYAGAYLIQVATSPLFSPPAWTFETENTSAVPTEDFPFTPTAGVDYFWRVCPLANLGGECLRNPVNNDVWWSQIWRTRFDPNQGLNPSTGTSVELIRPVHGDEYVETMPLFEWWPLQGANYYQFQLSRDINFNADILETTNTPYPAYTPSTSYAQRSLSKFDYGTFYWRVRAYTASGFSDWSSPRRFQVASQSEWRRYRALEDASNRLLVATDPDEPAIAPNYQLTTLYTAQSDDYWYFGFNVGVDTETMTYGMYLDIDHIDGSGANIPPTLDRNYLVSTVTGHRPEYAIFIDQSASLTHTFDINWVYIYKWLGASWDWPRPLSDIAGGNLLFTPGSPGYIELQIPNTAIGMSDQTSSMSISLFSVATTGAQSGQLQDSVPSDPEVPGSGAISRFTSVSERMNLIMPPTNTGGDPTLLPYITPLIWDYPTGGDPSGVETYPPSPWAGARVEIYTDPGFTNRVSFEEIVSNARYFGQNSTSWKHDVQGDNTYYWRVQPRYLVGSAYFGAWSKGWRFERDGYVPQNLRTSTTYATPTFSWNMVEGAESYDIQVSENPNFGTTLVNISRTPLNSYTPVSTLANGTYYWRVRVRRFNNIVEDWSLPQVFTLTLPTPTGLIPNFDQPTQAVPRAPTMCWDPILVSANGSPVVAAWKYRVQVSKDPNFPAGMIFDNLDSEQNCWTPTKGYDDGSYYWRVAMIDGNGRLGDYSATAQFIKQYPTTTLLSPLNGAQLSSVPTFTWSPVVGAASYKIEISVYSTFSNLFDGVVTNNTRYTPTKIVPTNTIYYWRVAMIDKDNKYGPFNDATIILGSGIRTFLPMVVRR